MPSSWSRGISFPDVVSRDSVIRRQKIGFARRGAYSSGVQVREFFAGFETNLDSDACLSISEMARLREHLYPNVTSKSGIVRTLNVYACRQFTDSHF